ncbi:MAG: hypothetical protein AUG51_00280 [Acidobacteria bacterium 13_1_20CM_3_53_8]|nr:MAG: hypothetical protein AUG51_00280 [Acidobacteria bacterium 13_1_20CM_3_53_8]
MLLCIALVFTFTELTIAQDDNGPDAIDPVIINFDNLPNNTVVGSQYPQVTFSSEDNFYHPSHTWNYCGYCVTSSSPNFVTSGTGYDSHHELILDFKWPVKNLSFYIVGPDNYGTIAQIDIWENGTYARTVPINNYYGSSYYPLFDDLSSFGTKITRIRIYNVTDVYGIGFDDITFTPNPTLSITNPRVSGNLSGTTQNALIGADVRLQASLSPAGSGTYAWSFTGQQGTDYDLVGGTNIPSPIIRWKKPGSYKASVTYSESGMSIPASVNVNVILPTLSSFTAQSTSDQVSRDRHCTTGLPGAIYSLGCYQGGADDGIIFTARVQIPSVQYLSDPAQSGIKIKQFVSAFRKRVNDVRNGNFECITVRQSQDQVDTGWQLDSDAVTIFAHPAPNFSQGNVLTYNAFDPPADTLDSYDPSSIYFSMNDLLFVDDRFQTYVYYYVGDPLLPMYEQPLKLATENNYQFSYIGWRWNGQVIFDPSVSFVKYRLQFSNTPSIFLAGINSLPTLHGTVNSNYGACPGDSALSNNMIDGARCFVKQQYWDFLSREPDQGGLDFWTSQIARCEFDRNCIGSQRNVVANEFFRSAEFQQTDPAMANPPGSPNFDPSVYNRAFVSHCYRNFLQRDPEPGGLAFWTDVLNRTGDYTGVINAFITSYEYRNQRQFHPCP